METEENNFKSVNEEVQAFAQVCDEEALLPPLEGYIPLALQDSETGKFEISVVSKSWYEFVMAKSEAETGEAFIPFGGGSPNKIILFGSDKDEYSNVIPPKKYWIDWAMKLAEEIALSMNDGNHPFPQNEQ